MNSMLELAERPGRRRGGAPRPGWASGWRSPRRAGRARTREGPVGWTTYAGCSWLAAALTVATGTALGSRAWSPRSARSHRLGDLTLLAAVVWFAPVWVGWAAGPARRPQHRHGAAGFFLPLLTHVVLAFPAAACRPSPRERWSRRRTSWLTLVPRSRSLSSGTRSSIRTPGPTDTDNVFRSARFPGAARERSW